jgi:hypothetical protein
MQATKTRGLAKTYYGEQTKWRKTYGKPIPCHVRSCIPGVENQVYGAATGTPRILGGPPRLVRDFYQPKG